MESTTTVERIEPYLDALQAVTDEARIRVTDEGFSTASVDEANVLLVDTAFTGFDAHEVNGAAENGDEPPVVGMRLPKLEDALGVGGSDSMLRLESNDFHRFSLTIDNLNVNIAGIDPDTVAGEPDVPEQDPECEFTVEWRHINRALKAADMVSDTVEFHADEEGAVEISARGDSDDVDLTLVSELESIDCAESIDAAYSLDYLKSIDRAIPGGDTEVTMWFSDDHPMNIEYTSDDGDTDVYFMLAPRIDSH